MSGPAIHHIVAREYLKSLKSKYSDADNMALWNGMDSGIYAPAYHFGAQGPDFLFFKMSDWPAGQGVKNIAETYWKAKDILGIYVIKSKILYQKNYGKL
jgi:hypothetical protein